MDTKLLKLLLSSVGLSGHDYEDRLICWELVDD